MRRPQSAFGPTAVTLGLLVILTAPAPAAARPPVGGERPPRLATRTAGAARLARTAREARAAGTTEASCTGWRSDLVPPATVRVLRAKARSGVPSRVVGTVQEVPFREYVGVVLAAEWPRHYPLETLKAGAIAVKQYAWYYTIVYRGGFVKDQDGSRQCYDVVDTTRDQVYYPERWSPASRHVQAIEATWEMTLRKYSARRASSRFFLTGYRAGSGGPCAVDANGWKLFQRTARRCGLDGRTFREILRLYLSPRLEIVTTGRHDILGTERGDAAALIRDDGGRLAAHVWTPGSRPPGPGTSTSMALSPGGLVGTISSDADGDGRDDLMWLRQTGARSGRLKVARSDGVDYGAPELWYEGTTGGKLDGAFLLAGDFNANGRRDAAILAPGDEPGTAAVHVFTRRRGRSFREPVLWWSGPLDLGQVRSAWAGDVSGDGRADLIVREDAPGGGVRIRIARARRPDPGLGRLRLRFEDLGLRAGRTRIVPGDADRDGREDLLLVTRSGDPGRVYRLRGSGSGKLTKTRLWTAPRTDPIPVGGTRVGAADVDYDGRSDLVLFSRAESGTRVRVLRTRYTKMKRGSSFEEDWLEWSRVRPY